MTRADPHSGAAALRVRAHLGEEAPQRIVRCRLQCCGPIATPGDVGALVRARAYRPAYQD